MTTPKSEEKKDKAAIRSAHKAACDAAKHLERLAERLSQIGDDNANAKSIAALCRSEAGRLYEKHPDVLMTACKRWRAGTRLETLTCGWAEVVDYVDATNVVIQFDNTGHRSCTDVKSLERSKKPRIKDPMARNTFGVGYIGVGPHRTHNNGKDGPIYSRWRGMLRRCYYESPANQKPAYRDVTVCDEWHCFQNFADWYVANYPSEPAPDGHDWQLDKDIRSNGERVYGPDTCCFVSMTENLRARGGAS